MAIETGAGTQTEAIIRKYIAENLVFEDSLRIEDEDSFLENSVIDSTGILELILFVEETFGVEVKDEEVVPENFDSISRLAGYIRRKHRMAEKA